MKRQISRMLIGFAITAFILGWQFGFMDEMIDGITGLVPDIIEEKAASAVPDVAAAPDWLRPYVVNNPFLPGYDPDKDPRFAIDLRLRTKAKLWPVLDVIDGDSLVVLDEDDRERQVELAGIDAFELDQPIVGELALERLSICAGHREKRGPSRKDDLIREGYPRTAFEKGALGGSVILDVMGEDEKGRMIAYVHQPVFFHNGRYEDPERRPPTKISCNYQLVHQGNAYRTNDDPDFIEAEDRQGRSIRDRENPTGIPPWEWLEIVAQDDLP